MTFRTPARLAVLGLAATLAVACDTEKTPTAEPAANTSAAPATPTAGETTVPPTLQNAQNQAADLKAAAGAKADETTAAAQATAKDAGDKANAAGDTLVAQAQKLYADAEAAIKKADFSGAQQYVDQLSALKSKLPADWQTKVTELEKMLADGKAKLGAVQMPKIGQ